MQANHHEGVDPLHTHCTPTTTHKNAYLPLPIWNLNHRDYPTEPGQTDIHLHADVCTCTLTYSRTYILLSRWGAQGFLTP